MTFTPNMAVRAGQAAFDASPIFQGKWDGTGTPDVVSFPRGDLLGNQTQFFYSNFDPYQGSISFWITPEWAGGDGIEHNIAYTSSNYRVYKSTGNALVLVAGGQTYTGPSTAAWVAGTAYYVVASWDTKNTIDGTNYARWSVNDAHTYSMTTQPTASAPDAAVYVGSTSTPTLSADANIEGFVVSRIVWYDGTYGVPMWFDASGPIDVINAIYAAGAGADPATTFGSWGVCGFLPTDQTQGPLQTTGQMWSHPHGSELIDVPFADDGGLPGTPYAVEFDGTTTSINCGSDVDIDDIADDAFTVGIWVRMDGAGEGGNFTVLVDKELGDTGWSLYTTYGVAISGEVKCATTQALSKASVSMSQLWDGEWHHITMFFDDAGDRTVYLALDGEWFGSYDTQDAGVGVILSDAGNDLTLGHRAGFYTLNGAIAWAAISNNDRHSHGTDFIPPRTFPADDANYVASWAMDEGTGVAAANTGNQGGAGSGAANRDGTISNGSWSAIWAIVGTPEIPQSILYNATTTNCVVSDAAVLQDLQDAAVTIDVYFRADGWGEGNTGHLITKAKWVCFVLSGTGLRVVIDCATTDADSRATFSPDSQWHLLSVQYDDAGDRKIYLWLDGIPFTSYGLQQAGVGAIVSDVGDDLYLGNRADGAFCFGGALGGWARLSDVLRYTNGNAFVLDARNNPPAPDGNTIWQTDYSDGAGATLADDSGNGNDGTLTNYEWNNTPDLATEEPGRQVYNQGYNIGSDGANDGIYIPVTLTASTDYVIRVPLQYSPNAWPRITLYDVTGAASLVDFDAPPLTGVHSGANNSATLTVANEVFPASLIGAALYNVTDGSSTTITAVGGTNQDTITGVLAGGTDNDWDTNDVYYIVPVTGWVFNEPIVRKSAATTPHEVRITNRNSSGVTTEHQAEVLLSALAQGDMEAGAGDPYIPTGWTNVDLDAGDTLAEATVIHSGAQSLEFATGASDEGIRQQITAAEGAYVHVSMWSYGDGSAGFTIGGLDATKMVVHGSTTVFSVATPHTAGWSLTEAVFRVVAANPSIYILADSGASGARYIDDVSAVVDTDVTLTVTPASEANSLEANGIRIDGRDSATVPATAHKMKARSGGIKWRATPRHSLANAQGFGQTAEYLLDLTEDANNYLRVYRTTNTLTLAVNQQGAGEVTDTDATAWAADTEVLIEVVNKGSKIQVKRDGAVVCELTGLAGFAADFTAVAYFGSEDTPGLEFDGVISPP